VLKKMLIILLSTGPSICAPVNYTNRDISLEPTISRPTSQRVYLISYADGEVYQRNQNYLMLSALNKGIDTLIAFRREHIKKEFYEEHKSILDKGRGAGYWLWKPYFIVETLKAMNENDILIYLDAGVYFDDKPIQPLIDTVNDPETSIILFESYHTNWHYIKRDAFDIMGVDYSHRNDKQCGGGYIIIKKTETSVAFMNKFLHYCCNEQALTDSPSMEEEFSGFWEHRHDQAIISLLSFKEPKGIKKIDGDGRIPSMWFFHLHRRRDSSVSILES
jgi:hypothetical protein